MLRRLPCLAIDAATSAGAAGDCSRTSASPEETTRATGNHARHLCRECAHLPADEREYRQCERDIERLLHDGLHVPRKRRAQFDRFLAHPNARVRELARRILEEQRREAEELGRMRAAEEARAEDFDVPGPDDSGAGRFDDEGTITGEPEPPDDDDLPF